MKCFLDNLKKCQVYTDYKSWGEWERVGAATVNFRQFGVFTICRQPRCEDFLYFRSLSKISAIYNESATKFGFSTIKAKTDFTLRHI